MSKIEELKQKYQKDIDQMGSKSRFGYFSIPPNPYIANGESTDNKIIRDENGKVKTEERNIFSGLTTSGVLKKSFFNYESSVYRGDPYLDPGKNERLANLEENKKLLGKDVYKPASLVKTPDPKAAFQHIPQKIVKKTVKDCVDQNGKVVTQPRGVMGNSTSTIEKERLKQFKYVHDPYENFKKVSTEEAKSSIKMRGEAPFKPSSPAKDVFCSSRSVFSKNDKCVMKEPLKQMESLPLTEHDSQFKPSCCKKYDTFSYPGYIPIEEKEPSKTCRVKATGSEKQSFKSGGQVFASKPSPSISTFRSNIMRSIR